MLLTRLGLPRLWGDDQAVLWAYLRFAVTPVVYGLTRAAAYGVDRVPVSDGAIVAANHLNAIDHPLLGVVCPRPVYFISKAELLEVPVLGEFLGFAGVFPVHRGKPDREALRRCRDLARDGNLVGIHVEGTRQRAGHPGEARKGAALIALQEGVPIVPLGLETFGWSFGHPRRCAAVWGEPIRLDEFPRTRTGRAEATDRVKTEIVRLWRLAGEAVAAGFPQELSDGTVRSRLPKPSIAEVRGTWAAARAKENGA